MTLSPSQIVVAAKDQLSCDLGGEEVILDLESGVYFGLNPVGSRIWSLINESRSVQSIVDVLLTEYQVDVDECKKEVIDFLTDLAEHGLVKIVP